MTDKSLEKTCKKCNQAKPLAEFYPSKQHKEGYHHQCKICHNSHNREYRRVNYEQHKEYGRTRHLWEHYRLTPEAYSVLAAHQNHVCAICKQPPNATGRHTMLQVDHDHETGQIRGLLCNNCNNALGRLGDSINGVVTALTYLLDHPATLPEIEVPKDRARRGVRHHWQANPECRLRGELHGLSRMSDERAREILQRAKAGENQYALAREYGIAQPTVSALKVGRLRRHLQDD